MNCTDVVRGMVKRDGHWEWAYSPRTDIVEMDDRYELVVELPGVSTDKVELQVEDGELTISATKNGTPEGGDYLLRERRAGTYSRSFRLGEHVDRTKIEAQMKDGILTVRVSKAAAALPRKISIQ